jgi:acyl-CoA reductase-like NAD-dependent aldehyde dehydrogenase
LANRAIAPALIEKLKRHIIKMYGENPQLSPDYGRIVNARHFSRICGLLAEANVVFGGQTDPTERYIAPTLVTNPAPNSPLLSEEIFGPILPIIEYDTLDDAFEWVNKNPNPLAAYFFSQNSTHKQRFLRMSFGGGIINDTTTHLTESNLPFGGIGNSGMGTYRGKAGFDAFTHKKGVIFKSSLATDLLVRYPPYSKLKLALARLILR